MKYVVQKGDTLYSISKKYDISVSELMEMNSLTSPNLQIGQVLNVSASSYIVQKGDTLYSIARKYGMSVSDLIAYNDLDNSVLQIGQVLRLTPVSDIVIGSSCYGSSFQEPTYITYQVKKGDTLYRIAKQYGVSVDSIIKLNALSSSSLSIGQILKIKEND